jgi:hypothetical protein
MRRRQCAGKGAGLAFVRNSTTTNRHWLCPVRHMLRFFLDSLLTYFSRPPILRSQIRVTREATCRALTPVLLARVHAACPARSENNLQGIPGAGFSIPVQIFARFRNSRFLGTGGGAFSTLDQAFRNVGGFETRSAPDGESGAALPGGVQ